MVIPEGDIVWERARSHVRAGRSIRLIWTAVVLAAPAGLACQRDPGEASQGVRTTAPAGVPATQAGGDYDYNRSAASRPAASRFDDDLKRSVNQWPSDAAGQMRAMDERLTRVSETIGKVAGVLFIPRLEQTGRGAQLHPDGTVSVDPSSLWRLSEDGLAALLARAAVEDVATSEFTRHVPGRERQKLLSGGEVQEQTGTLSLDEMAGRLVRRAGFRQEGFAELLRKGETTGWAASPRQPFGGLEQRIGSFQRGYLMETRLTVAGNEGDKDR